MEFIHQKPFRTNTGEVITMKAVVTNIHVQCYENKTEYKPDQLTPMSNEEYEADMNNDLE